VFTHFFIDRPILSAVISILVVLAGAVSMTVSPIEQYPDMAPPQVVIDARYPGATADVIANNVAAPIETQLNGVDNLLYYYSNSSSSGNSQIVVVFKPGSNPDINQVNVQNKLSQAMPMLPQVVTQQGIIVDKKSPSIMMVVSVYSPDDRYDTAYINNYANLYVLEELKRVPGANRSSSFGLPDIAMRVWLLPDRMAQLGITVQEVSAAIQSQNQAFGIGQLGAPPMAPGVEQMFVVTAQGLLTKPEEFENIIVRTAKEGSAIVRVKDVGRVELSQRDYSIPSRLNGKAALTMSALLGPVFLQDKTWAGIFMNYFDSGASLLDGANLLVMDMDLCVRCGNCSLACHKVHGQSRLLRRGISITRPVSIGSEGTQHVLSPQVCMHCKDPECLTGCPTGSIFRDPRGYVDIDPATCIGCFDCATQCPYDAISMVPRKGAPVVTFDFMGTLRKTFSLTTPPPPSFTLTPADDVVAIKCNLCEHTPLNPQGAPRQAYSCEENCPTGALLRVDPVKYFTEVDRTQGLIFRDQTQAFGRNIHKSDPLAKAFHVSGGALILLAGVAVIAGLAARGFDGVLAGTWLTMRWVTGLVGLFGIAVVMTYPLRKQVYRRRAGALRYWMLMHVYIGALAGLVLMLHAGSHTGGLLTTSLYIAFDVVIISGLFGIASYVIAPRILTSIEGEPLLIEDLVARHAELRQELDEILKQSEGWLKEEIEERVVKKFSRFSFLMRQFMRREQLTGLLANARRAFKERLTRLATNEERTLLLRAVETTVTLRRVDALIYLHKILKLWIAPHVISTSVMLALMVVHIIQVVYFAVK